jgi:methylglyoxal synthase
MNIALIAHDNKKADMVAFILKRLEFFSQVSLFATGTTGKHVQNAGLKVKLMKSGPQGGDAQIASMLVNGEIDAVFFFIDPLTSHAHEVDVQMLLRLCNVYDVPIATNQSTAKLIAKQLQSEILHKNT